MTHTTVEIAAKARRAAKSAGVLSVIVPRRESFTAHLQTRGVEKDGKTFLQLEGCASVVEKSYRMFDCFGEYDEIVDAAAFDVTLAASPDVVFLLNHTGLAMARTKNGTLTLSADDEGLQSSALLNPTRSDVTDLAAAIDDGVVTEMSFAFRIESGQWSPDYTEYRINQVDLDRGDVSAVNYGANPHTSISARSLYEALDRLEGPQIEAALRRLQAREPQALTIPTGASVALLRAHLAAE